MAYSRRMCSSEIESTKELIINYKEFVAFDIETTGLSPLKGDSIIEIGAVKIVNGEFSERFHSMVDPEMAIPYRITQLTGICDEDVEGWPTYKDVLKSFKEFVGGSVLIAHNAKFDMSFIQHFGNKIAVEFDQPYVDTLKLSRYVLRELESHKLNLVAEHLNIRQKSHHRADDDARVCGEIFLCLSGELKKEIKQELDYKNDHKNKDTSTSGETVNSDYLGIKKIAYWEKGNLQRIYVNGISFTAFFDINRMQWVEKSQQVDLKLLHHSVCNLLGVTSYEEMSKFRGTKTA